MPVDNEGIPQAQQKPSVQNEIQSHQLGSIPISPKQRLIDSMDITISNKGMEINNAILFGVESHLGKQHLSF